MHYHHLRHSFATWTFTRLMLSDLAQIPDLLPGHDATNSWLKESKQFREQLYGYHVHTRKHAYVVASLLGHSGPSISFEHYVHSLEWLLPLFLSNSALFASTTAELIKASNIPASTAYVLSKRRLQDIL